MSEKYLRRKCLVALTIQSKMILEMNTKQQLEAFIARPSHAVGILGADGAGKGYVATYIVATLLNRRPEEIHEHPYVFVLDAQDKGTIEQVRELQTFLALVVPGKSHLRRAIIIEHMDNLGIEAQNALLKTLEEPPMDTIIVCTVMSQRKLLPTIKSRLQWLRVQPTALDSLQSELNEKYKPEEVRRAYYMSEGQIGLMLSILERPSDHPLAVSVDKAKEVLKASKFDRLAMIDGLTKDKEMAVADLLDALQRLLHVTLRAASNRTPVNREEIQRLKKQLTLVIEARELLETKVQPKLVLTRLFYSL